MAGLLRKLAGLVVEFPEDQKTPGSAKAGAQSDPGETDVVAAIEQIRADLEKSGGLDPAKLEEEDRKAEPAAADPEPAAKSGAKAVGDNLATTEPAIRLPIVLGIKQVYERAELPPSPGGFDLEKVSSMLADPEIADLPLEVRARSVKMAIRAAGGDLKEVLADAARRDQALEVYLDYMLRRVQEVKSQVEQQNAGLEREIEDFIAARRAIIESNKAKLDSAQEALARFQKDKVSEEQRLFQTVAPFVSAGENPVIISGSRGGDVSSKE